VFIEVGSDKIRMRKNQQTTFIDLFAGIGGFRKAFEKAGFKCVFSSEIDVNCQEVYFDNFGEVPSGDITKISPKDIPGFDILLAGFPCQPFSISGRKQGFNDTRGTLFFEICKIIEKKQPATVVLENVKHLIYHDYGRTLKIILQSLSDLGYYVNYAVLNAKNFGVPQHRERIFIIGSKTGYFNFRALKMKPVPKLKDFLDKNGKFEMLKKSEYTLIKKPRMQESGLIFVGYRNKNTWKVGVRPNTEHLSRVHRQPNRIYSIEGVHPTLPSQETSGRFFIYDDKKDYVRKLTIDECYRIMGFPDNFIKHVSLGEAYKQIGNSVCIPLCEEVARAINKPEEVIYEPQGKVDRNLQFVLFD
jgi:DNA (cytosine-5)-methyltransferase 1